VQSDHLGDAPLEDSEAPYDVATCMFGIHYFFEQREMLEQLLQNVAANLKPGGWPAPVPASQSASQLRR